MTYFSSLLYCWTGCFLLCVLNHVMSSQDEHYEDEEEGGEDVILGSSFGRRNVEVYDLPESEEVFLPSNMDTTQLMFRFKEVAPCAFHLIVF